MEGEFLDQLNDYQLFKKPPSPVTNICGNLAQKDSLPCTGHVTSTAVLLQVSWSTSTKVNAAGPAGIRTSTVGVDPILSGHARNRQSSVARLVYYLQEKGTRCSMWMVNAMP
jgi:hypothetical protein